MEPCWVLINKIISYGPLPFTHGLVPKPYVLTSVPDVYVSMSFTLFNGKHPMAFLLVLFDLRCSGGSIFKLSPNSSTFTLSPR